MRPRRVFDVLLNPGMGITTVPRCNGDAINPGLKWSEQGPTSILPQAEAKPDFPDTSTGYFRWFWSQIEPERGTYHWQVIALAPDEARRHRQTLMFRPVPYDQQHPVPEWYRDSGARRDNKPADKDSAIWPPDSGDPLCARARGEAVAGAGQRYDGHPSLDSADISTFGNWGEAWGPYPPDWPTQKELIDQYFSAFHRTPLLMNFDELQALDHAVHNGAGWRMNRWGDLGRPGHLGWSHMLDLYPQQVVEAGAEQTWKRRPVSLAYILDQALRRHATSINIKSTAIPAEWKAPFDAFQKKIGYRFAPRRFEYPRAVRAGHMAMFRMWWLNEGVAPAYREYILALELRSPGPSRVIRTDAHVREWLPGGAVFEDTLYVPDDLRAGDYHVRAALLDPRTAAPAVRRAIEGRQEDGWYDLGAIPVE